MEPHNAGGDAPLRYLRAFIYFAIRYFLKGGILDGHAGWMWNFWQGLWYRCLVDHEIGLLRSADMSQHDRIIHDPPSTCSVVIIKQV